MTAHGVVQITDRIKDVIKTGGEWISSIELEDILLQMPSLARRDHRRGGCQMGRATARVPGARPRRRCARTMRPPLQKHVKAYADKGVISRFAIPDRIMFVDALDKTSVGKIDKKVLRAKYGDG